jgi:protein-S-isoprenylcysteine O-methyltransferase Ste14
VAPLPLTEPGARIAFFVLLGTWVVLEWRIRLRSHFDRRGPRADRSLPVVVAFVYGGLTAGFLIAERVRGAAIADGRWAFFVAGLILMSAGIAIRQWAVAVLGRYFTIDVRVHRDQVVVARGPYRWVRHPSYTGLILTFVGIGFALGNWAALAVLAVVPTAGLVLRIRVEERALLHGLGEPYRRFAASRPRLFPGLW